MNPPRTSSPTARLLEQYRAVRAITEALCDPLEIEDYGVQSMPDVSPVKWHLAHTAWFFETFLLAPFLPGYRPFHPKFGYLFNSYYEAVGARHPRCERGLLSRPTVEEVYRYRAYVDRHMLDLLGNPGASWTEIEPLVTLGLNHEQQHQELILTDVKHVLGTNPLRPVYRPPLEDEPGAAPAPHWREIMGGVVEVGHTGDGFAFDNEAPRHSVYLQDYRLTSRLVTNGDWLEFIAAGGYVKPQFWLSEGWRTVQERGWQAPLYWEQIDGEWWQMTLAGMQPVIEAEPVNHVSYFEADAFATWAGKRLPTETEWETAAASEPIAGNLLETGRLHVQTALAATTGLQQLYGDVWEWTQSAYSPYPGFHSAPGAVGEYNGKFMCGQFVLRGGSCFTPTSHVRPTYRNFFPPDARWQCTGLRLAEGPL